MRKPCRFITSSFILQEKAHSDDRILLSILSVLAWAVFPNGMTAMTGMTGILGCPAAVIPYGRTPYTLLRKVVCQTFPLDSLMAGLTPCLSSALRFGWKDSGVAHVSMRGHPKTAVIPVMAVMLPAASCKDNLPAAILPLIVILDAVLIKER